MPQYTNSIALPIPMPNQDNGDGYQNPQNSRYHRFLSSIQIIQSTCAARCLPWNQWRCQEKPSGTVGTIRTRFSKTFFIFSAPPPTRFLNFLSKFKGFTVLPSRSTAEPQRFQALDAAFCTVPLPSRGTMITDLCTGPEHLVVKKRHHAPHHNTPSSRKLSVDNVWITRSYRPESPHKNSVSSRIFLAQIDPFVSTTLDINATHMPQ